MLTLWPKARLTPTAQPVALQMDLVPPWRAGHMLPSLLLQPQGRRPLSTLTQRAFTPWGPEH